MVVPPGWCRERPTDEFLPRFATVEQPVELPCIRCGICCSVYQVRISRAEAERIAKYLGIDYWNWVGRYHEPRWPDPASHLIKHDARGCVFLRRDQTDARFSLCGIYDARPDSCRNWNAGILKPACQEGLRRYWQVDVTCDGRMTGSCESLARLELFMRHD